MRHNWPGAFLPLTLGACAAQIHTSSRVTYVAPRPVKLDTLAMLPVSSGEGLEGFRRMISDSLFVRLTKARRDLVVLPAESTLSRLNSAGLNEKYAQAIRDYQQTSVLDRGTVDTMSRTLHARFLLYIRAAYSQGKTVSGGFPHWLQHKPKSRSGSRGAHLGWTTRRCHLGSSFS
jgi:hypothetical protein